MNLNYNPWKIKFSSSSSSSSSLSRSLSLGGRGAWGVGLLACLLVYLFVVDFVVFVFVSLEGCVKQALTTKSTSWR